MSSSGKRKPEFKVGQVVHVKDWKGAERLGKIVELYAYDDGPQYIVEWSRVERMCQDTKGIRALTKREAGQ